MRDSEAQAVILDELIRIVETALQQPEPLVRARSLETAFRAAASVAAEEGIDTKRLAVFFRRYQLAMKIWGRDIAWQDMVDWPSPESSDQGEFDKFRKRLLARHHDPAACAQIAATRYCSRQAFQEAKTSSKFGELDQETLERHQRDE